jgi:hypothetical protein
MQSRYAFRGIPGGQTGLGNLAQSVSGGLVPDPQFLLLWLDVAFEYSYS